MRPQFSKPAIAHPYKYTEWLWLDDYGNTFVSYPGVENKQDYT